MKGILEIKFDGGKIRVQNNIYINFLHTVDPHLSGLHLSGGSDYPDTKFPGIAFCTLVMCP